MSCNLVLAQNWQRDCTNPAVAGIEQKVVLINRSLLPRTGITFDGTYPDALLTNIALSSGQGYYIEGKGNMFRYTDPFEVANDQENGVKHRIEGLMVVDQTPAGRAEMNKILKGGNFFAVIERKWKGASSAHAFLFFGLEHGLELVEGGGASEENSGQETFVLGTPGDYKEPVLPHILLITDYATTKTAFDNLFAAA